MNQRKIGAIISYAQMIIGIIISLIYTPFMIKLLGQNEYGLYNTVASTISMMGLLNLGFNSSYIRYYSKYKKNHDLHEIYRLNGLFIVIFFILGIIAFICGIFLYSHIQFVFSEGLTDSEYELAKKLLLLLIVNLSISFPMSVFADIISAHEKFIFLKLLGVMRTVCSPLVTLPLLFAGYRSVAIVIVTMLFAFITDVAYLYYTLKKLKIRFWFTGVHRGLFLDLFTYTSFIAINLIVDQINWNVDKVLLARYKGTVAVAIYSVGFTLNTYYSMVSTAVSGVFTPLVHKIVNSTCDSLQEQKRQLTDLFTRVGRVQFLILTLFASGLIFFGKSFISFWAGNNYEEAYYVVLLLALPATIPLIQNIGIEIQRAENKHKYRSIVYFIMAIINLLMSIYLCQLYGAIGSAIGTAISLLIANGFLINWYYYKYCNIDIISFWKNIARVIPGFILPCIIGTCMKIWVEPQSLFQLSLWIILYMGIYVVSIFLFSMNQYERALLRKPMEFLFKSCK